MKKFTKLSLVAAVAVAGLTSANAKPLEEAIKDVDVSGTVTYRYDNFGNDKTGETNNANKYKINFNLSSKVNDYVKFNSRFNVGSTSTNNDFVNLDKAAGTGDTNKGVDLAHAYFGLSVIPNTTVNVGKQGLATPWTVATDNDGAEQTGTGIFSVTAVDKFVVGLAYFNQTNINNLSDFTANTFKGSEDIYAATLQANYGIVNAEAWYLNAVDQFDTYTLAVHGKADLADNANIGYEVRYVSLDASDMGAGDTHSLTRVAVNGKVGIVNARLAYSVTDEKGGITALDTDAQNASLGWRLNTLNKADAKFLQATLGADILDNLNFSVSYNSLEYKAAADAVTGVNKDPKQNEVFAQLTYKMSKNLDGYIRYGQQDMDKANDSKENSGRLQVNYKF
ncbi:MAG: major outer membrane protein [Aliarcobacter skirrowii]|uniref:major outer membrane protein n=1 Tax=Aliarcobacter skirrowii TaxID=28200 RepID=UPI0024331431|nr:major outer membrane protein [Aliarcobacter skirrowii]MDD2508591.1 major outer membrane protein [Aliarcobacter skirrowii]MDD3497204.1 major outer membrane protein [Aliarcobacter skirrowii]